MDRFRTLILVILLSGTIAGLLLFTIQHYTTFPLIEKAEVYESAAEHQHHDDDEEGWRPKDGIERTVFTAMTTILTAIGFAAMLFGLIALQPSAIDWRQGALWGIAAYLCIDLAPALGLPPQPPGVAVADLYARQVWWFATAASTAVALWLLFSKKSWATKASGILVAIIPHAIGAPAAPASGNAVPASLVQQFAIASILTGGVFWLALGSVGGLLYRRLGYVEQS